MHSSDGIYKRLLHCASDYLPMLSPKTDRVLRLLSLDEAAIFTPPFGHGTAKWVEKPRPLQ
ncbi:MAG: hypothetical protein DME18_12265 [Verrucomicrobia bacterium]|nr:MAG: hypothetical protein DME18_12265 [Verrucomicrobiota bacterium]